MSAGTTTTTLRGLQPDTLYTVTLVPVYAAGDGKRMSENGKTSKFEPPAPPKNTSGDISWYPYNYKEFTTLSGPFYTEFIFTDTPHQFQTISGTGFIRRRCNLICVFVCFLAA